MYRLPKHLTRAKSNLDNNTLVIGIVVIASILAIICLIALIEQG